MQFKKISNTMLVPVILLFLAASCGGGGEQETQERGLTADMIQQSESGQVESWQASNEKRTGTARLNFDNDNLTFGKVRHGDRIREQFRIKNTGDEPLELYDYSTIEGIEVTGFSGESILPGEDGYIELSLNSNYVPSGAFQEVLTLYTNSETGRARVRVSGEIIGGDALATDAQMTLMERMEAETDRYGRTPNDPHYGHNHPPEGWTGQPQGQQQRQQQSQQQGQQATDGERDQYGRPPGHEHYGHDHPPLDGEQDIQLQQQDAAGDGEKDEYGRSPGDPHYGHDHPILDSERNPDQQQQQPQIQQQQQQQQEIDPDAPEMNFEKERHDFGTIEYGEQVSTKFYFTNTGNTPLIINNVNAGCGCTAPSYSQEPVPPGERGYVEVAYDGGYQRVEQFNQTVRVEANTNQGTHSISIHGEINQ